MSEPTTCFPFTLLEDLDVELSKQTQKHGLMPSDPFHCACILTEECGEVARAVHDAHYDARYAKASRLDNLCEELLQTAVFALRWYEKLKGQQA